MAGKATHRNETNDIKEEKKLRKEEVSNKRTNCESTISFCAFEVLGCCSLPLSWLIFLTGAFSFRFEWYEPELVLT